MNPLGDSRGPRAGADAGGDVVQPPRSGEPPTGDKLPIGVKTPARSGAGNTAPLAALVRSEALRAEAGGRIRPDPARIAAGWQRRFVIEKGRATDLARLYAETGYEVAQDPVAPELVDDECVDCRLVAQLEYVSLYTRQPEIATGSSGPEKPSPDYS